MFHVNEIRASRRFCLAIFGLAMLCLMALIVTLWIFVDFQHEQQIVAKIIKHLPASDLASARELANELHFHSQLSILLVLNIIATCIALGLLVRAYVHSQRSLRAVKVFASDVLASMDQGVLTTDTHSVITSITPRGLELLGVNEAIIGQPLIELDKQHAMLAVICRHVSAHHSPVRDCEYRITTHGYAQTLRAACSLLSNEQQEELGTVIHIRDVTERALIEQRLRRMERYSGLGALATGLHHEIRNPLSALSLHVQLLEEALNDHADSEEIDEMLVVLKTEVNRLTAVLEGFRRYASMAEPSREEVDLATVITRLVRLIGPQAGEQQVKIETRFSEDSSFKVMADSVGIDQVLLNLTLNALQAMPSGGTLTIQVYPCGNNFCLEVADTGNGIPSRFHDHIFDPYFTTRTDGTGMGLALCEKIVSQHDGTIEFHTSSAGTTFSILLPMSISI